MRILGIESTCDETAAAVVEDGVNVRSNIVATQFELHAKYRGVVPEIASRAHIENILPVVRESLAVCGLALTDIDAIAVAHRPGLIGSLLIGVTAAKTLAWSLQKPLIGIDHVHAHLYSVMLEKIAPVPIYSEGKIGTGAIYFPEFPAVGLVISGGHTALYDVRNWTDITLIGSTIDDAVGEAYDKVASILGLAYPGGPIIDQLAQQGDPTSVKLPRSLMARDSLDFSFSGLKTAVLYHVRGVPGRGDRPTELNEKNIRDIAASFQAACIDTILTKLNRAVARTHAKSIIIGGGVSANRGLRDALAKFSLPVYFPQLQYCTDNAAMTAGLAHVMYERKNFSGLDLDAITYSQFRL
jgi:N6-L-threonylcarbamoyladenine synthase